MHKSQLQSKISRSTAAQDRLSQSESESPSPLYFGLFILSRTITAQMFINLV